MIWSSQKILEGLFWSFSFPTTTFPVRTVQLDEQLGEFLHAGQLKTDQLSGVLRQLVAQDLERLAVVPALRLAVGAEYVVEQTFGRRQSLLLLLLLELRGRLLLF